MPLFSGGASITSASQVSPNTIATDAIQDDAVTLAKVANGTQGGVPYYGASGAPAELAAGTNGQYLKTGGAGANPSWGDAPTADVQTFTSTGANTWTKPANAKVVIAYLIGGGGGGCGGGATGGGGGGGEVVRGIFKASLLGSSETVTVGTGGTGGTGAAGSAGAATSLGTKLIARAGGGGLSGTSGGGYGGAVGADMDMTAAPWNTYPYYWGIGGTGNAAARAGGNGTANWASGGGNKMSNNGTPPAGGTQQCGTPTTNSAIGGNGGAGASADQGTGTAGGNYGGGGGGGPTTGGAGAPGIAVIVTYK